MRRSLLEVTTHVACRSSITHNNSGEHFVGATTVPGKYLRPRAISRKSRPVPIVRAVCARIAKRFAGVTRWVGV